MMDIRKIDETFAVSPQLQRSDLTDVAKAGYTTLVCNRPDGEEDAQPSADEMRAAGEAVGLRFVQIAVSGGAFPKDAIDAFRDVRLGADGPVLAYCRTGTRSITLDALANPDALSVDERIERARLAGYDLSAFRDRLV